MSRQPPTELVRHCHELRDLHRAGRPLVLPNVWDVASARIVVDAGYRAVATSSGAVAASIGYDDHEAAPAAEMLGAAGRIAAAVEVPVTVDAEAGYGLAPGDLIGRLVDVGAAGANIEDSDHGVGGLRSIDDQVARLAALRSAADVSGVPLVINARIDAFLIDRGLDAAANFVDAISRANAYLAAGADCVYPILLIDPSARDAFITAVDGAVNLLTWPGGASIHDLAAAGAARVSFGTTIHAATMTAMRECVTAIRSGEESE